MKPMGIALAVSLALVTQLAFAGSHDNAPAAVAVVTAEDFAALKSDFSSLAARFEQLAAENAELRAAQQANDEEVVAIRGSRDSMSWAERIKVKGDFRYRYQNDDVDPTVDNGGDSFTRNRQRIRARPAIIATLPNRIEVGIGLATGSEDPVSSNQTLGGGGSSKAINLDLAYFGWEAVDGMTLYGGKFKNQYARIGGNGLLWDSDWRPEGLQLVYDNDGLFFGNILGTWLESDSNSDDEFAYGAQAGLNIGLLEGLKLGAGYYAIDAAGRECFFDSDDCFGNTTNPDGTYAFDFKEVELFAELKVDLFGLPSTFFADLVRNTEADDLDTGYALGLRLNKAKKQGSWDVLYLYQDLEADAAFGLLVDSDFGGGGTDSKGHKLGFKYATTDQSTVTLTYIAAERQDSQGVFNDFQPFDVNTLQLDFGFKMK